MHQFMKRLTLRTGSLKVMRGLSSVHLPSGRTEGAQSPVDSISIPMISADAASHHAGGLTMNAGSMERQSVPFDIETSREVSTVGLQS